MTSNLYLADEAFGGIYQQDIVTATKVLSELDGIAENIYYLIKKCVFSP